jgi:hypothetical protein
MALAGNDGWQGDNVRMVDASSRILTRWIERIYRWRHKLELGWSSDAGVGRSQGSNWQGNMVGCLLLSVESDTERMG